MSQNAGDSPSPSPRFLRSNLRNATIIIPRTGERVRRSVTLKAPPPQSSGLTNDGPSDAPNDLDDSNQRTPLLFRRRRSADAHHRSSLLQATRAAVSRVWTWVSSPLGQSVLKCSIAYLLGCMATFVTPLAVFLGRQDGKHIVATVTVYFHSARSQGSMLEATLLAFAATLYASFVSFTSMGLSIFFARMGLIILGHVLVLILFCGGGLGFVGWLKLRLSNPLVNVACSLTSLSIITILTKEGSVQLAKFSAEKPIQVLKMVLMGIFATTAVCLLIFPVSARNELRKSMIEVTDTLGEMMTAITRSFLYGDDENVKSASFRALESRHNAALGCLTKHLREAKFEHYAWGSEKQYHLEVKIVDCIQRMAQDIGGLRSAALTQSTLLETGALGSRTPVYLPAAVMTPPTIYSEETTPHEPQTWSLSSIDELPEENGDTTSPRRPELARQLSEASPGLPTLSTPADIFSRFITQLGPSMKSLVYTLKLILDELPFSPGPEYRVTLDPHFRQSLDDAQELYSKSRSEALHLLYKSKELNKTRPIAVTADFEEVAASCGYFSFSLQDFSEEMETYLDALEAYKSEIEKSPRTRSWSWMKFWRKAKIPPGCSRRDDPERMALLERTVDLERPANLIEVPKKKKIEQNLKNSNMFRRRLYDALSFLRRDDIKFAIKVGVGAMIYAFPAFLPYTRPFYRYWRGEWGLLSYMLVCSMTIGASNTTGFQRVGGTCLGAVCAIVVWLISQANPFILAFFGWVMSIGCFYIIIAQGKGPMGRFILLTYNLSALYAYSISMEDEDGGEDEGGPNPHIFPIALHRVVAVITGCIWGMIITRLIWPISARSKLKEGLSVLWLKMSLIWKRDPLSTLHEGEHPPSYMSLSEELQLHAYLSRLRGLRTSATSEFELREPFPDASFTVILESTGAMLDAFHAMNVVILKDLKATAGEARLLTYTETERRELSWRISHLFQVLASSMKLEYPLNNVLPNIEHTRDRLLARTFAFRRAAEKDEAIKDEDYALLYAYALVTAQLASGIAEVVREIEKLFGVLDEEVLSLR